MLTEAEIGELKERCGAFGDRILAEIESLEESVRILSNTEVVRRLTASSEQHNATEKARAEGQYRTATLDGHDEHFVRFLPEGGGAVWLPYDNIWLHFERDAWMTGEIERLREALDASVKLQAHYAALLNMHDGGERIVFASTEEWLERLKRLKEENS